MTYLKKMLLFHEGRNVETIIRNYHHRDFEALIDVQRESFPPPFPSELWWNKEQLTNHITLFPEGALCVEVEGEIVASITGLLVDFDPAHAEHTWEEVTDNGYIRNHNPEGNTLYIVDICVKPAYRKMKLGKWMMQAMYELVVHKNLTRLLGGGRVPGFHLYAHSHTIEQYVEEVINGSIKDPVMSFLLACGRTPLQLVSNYLEDEESHNYAMLMEWKNPFNKEEE